MPPKISVLMSVYNSELYLAEAIDSILSQTFTDFEFIIVDDGSTDESGRILATYTKQDPRIRLLTLPENGGLANALNCGLDVTQGQFIARMDSDDISLPMRFEKQVEFLGHHPDVGVLGSRMQVVDQDKHPLFDFDVPLTHGLIVWNMFFGRTFAHPSVMIRRDVLQSVGGYNADLMTAQDVDLWARLVGLTQFHNLPDKLMIYRTHQVATSVSKAEQQNVVLRDTSKMLLEKLWGRAFDDTVQRFFNVRSGKSQFLQNELDTVMEEMMRLAQSLLSIGWITDDDMPVILAEIDRRVNLAEPQKRKFWKFWQNYNR